jgi:hypothetical protein
VGFKVGLGPNQGDSGFHYHGSRTVCSSLMIAGEENMSSKLQLCIYGLR